jgi:FAD/FMN-containing dehydrogenase
MPRTADELQAAVELAAAYQLPILPRAAGSSLVGQAVNNALILDVSRHLDQVIELNVEEQWVRVQPGIVLDELNLYLKPHGLQFGPDPASSNRACLGGIVANNSTGSHSIMYGMTADHLLATNVILERRPSGHIHPPYQFPITVETQLNPASKARSTGESPNSPRKMETSSAPGRPAIGGAAAVTTWIASLTAAFPSNGRATAVSIWLN